jgi:TonB-dependent SusC/RagA subfamily outer membrane receptor
MSSLFLGSWLLIGCATAPVSEDMTNDEPRTVQVNNAMQLTDLFVRLPGVFVDERGGVPEVYIRGRRPLFVVDGVQIGNNYRSVENAVNVNDVASVEVLRNLSETAIYGQQGSNGVILIKTIRY